MTRCGIFKTGIEHRKSIYEPCAGIANAIIQVEPSGASFVEMSMSANEAASCTNK